MYTRINFVCKILCILNISFVIYAAYLFQALGSYMTPPFGKKLLNHMTKWSFGISSCLLHGLSSPRNGNFKTFNASGKHVRAIYTPYTPLLYSKTGVCRGIPIFLIFTLKHRLWVLVRTASTRRF